VLGAKVRTQLIFLPLSSPLDSQLSPLRSLGVRQLLWYKQNQLYVPKRRFRDVLLKECHDGRLECHGGAKGTITLFKKTYYWPNLKDNVEEYVKICELANKI